MLYGHDNMVFYIFTDTHAGCDHPDDAVVTFAVAIWCGRLTLEQTVGLLVRTLDPSKR